MLMMIIVTIFGMTGTCRKDELYKITLIGVDKNGNI